MNEQQARNHDRSGERWREWAEECRAKAESQSDPRSRACLRRLAETYEGMAHRADGRASKERE